MRHELTIPTLALLLISPAAMASQSLLSDEIEIGARSTQEITAHLAPQSIRATPAEQVAGVIGVDTNDHSRADRVLLVEDDVLPSVAEVPSVGTQLKVTPHGRSKSRFNEAPRSLIESDDDDDDHDE